MHTESLDHELLGVDRLCERWAKYWRNERHLGQKLHPLARMIMQAEGAPLPGGESFMPDDLVKLDRIIAKGSAAGRQFLKVWYCSPSPVHIKAKALGVSRSALIHYWHSWMRYYQGALDHVE